MSSDTTEKSGRGEAGTGSPGVNTTDLGVIGEEIGHIPMYIGYRMIEVFSGQLYSTPAKAIEELVANSYDAFARNCQVIIPDTLDLPDSTVRVWDDGESMDQEGLRELWLVAESHKRDPQREAAARKKGRLPVGKFGVGKLASYVLGRRITHICRKGETILAVTMDFSRIPDDGSGSATGVPQKVDLPVRKLSVQDAFLALGNRNSLALAEGKQIELIGPGSKDEWTLVVL